MISLNFTNHFKKRKQKETPILHNLSQKRELEGTHHNLIYEDSIILTLNPDKGSIRKPGQSVSQGPQENIRNSNPATYKKTNL